MPDVFAATSRLRWLSITPFGAPVVPDVYISAATWRAASVSTGSARASSFNGPTPKPPNGPIERMVAPMRDGMIGGLFRQRPN